MNTTATLTQTQSKMIAASLEIDGRTDIAAAAVVPGHVTEFTYSNGQPFSAKAKTLAALEAELRVCVDQFGVEAVVQELRK